VLEEGLNDVGYRHLNAGRPQLAHDVFARNAALFPRSANVWDSLGEALWKLDRDDEAIAAYEHELELDPNSSSARTTIERIIAEQ
jgi:Flp pilus assembly protein TadD